MCGYHEKNPRPHHIVSTTPAPASPTTTTTDDSGSKGAPSAPSKSKQTGKRDPMRSPQSSPKHNNKRASLNDVDNEEEDSADNEEEDSADNEEEDDMEEEEDMEDNDDNEEDSAEPPSTPTKEATNLPRWKLTEIFSNKKIKQVCCEDKCMLLACSEWTFMAKGEQKTKEVLCMDHQSM